MVLKMNMENLVMKIASITKLAAGEIGAMNNDRRRKARKNKIRE